MKQLINYSTTRPGMPQTSKASTIIIL